MRALPLALTLLALPALAQEPLLDPNLPTAPGAVALYLQARGLGDLGTRLQDPLLVLTSARILRGITLVDSRRSPVPAAPAEPVISPDPAALLDLARMIDAGGTHADLIDTLAREVPPAPLVLQATAATLRPGEAQVWTLPFFGGEASELAIMGQGSTNLDVVVSGPGDTQICSETGSDNDLLCSFALLANGEVTVSVTNPGRASASYLLLTD